MSIDPLVAGSWTSVIEQFNADLVRSYMRLRGFTADSKPPFHVPLGLFPKTVTEFEKKFISTDHCVSILLLCPDKRFVLELILNCADAGKIAGNTGSMLACSAIAQASVDSIRPSESVPEALYVTSEDLPDDFTP